MTRRRTKTVNEAVARINVRARPCDKRMLQQRAAAINCSLTEYMLAAGLAPRTMREDAELVDRAGWRRLGYTSEAAIEAAKAELAEALRFFRGPDSS